MSVLQLIDENKQFSRNVDEYFRQIGVADTGLKYHVVSVFGSQSTGKSTLLNALFGTRFGVMDERQRGQTTRGIWMGHDSQETKEPVLILDVEGTDGRERGEDQDFERKAALFALATSEVLIVNMWEHQVGLYQGANMGLLKTVFEVNLSLFQSGRGQQQRSRIVFVIRDYMGLTPLENLAATLDEDLERHWESIAKPDDVANSHIRDFFDLEYTALPHKLLQEDRFADGVTKLRTKLVTTAFDPSYHRQVPIDGWAVYAEQIWQQIELNKDLDLPTQQILVARFRCEEIAAETFTEFQAAIDRLGITFGDSAVLVPQFGEVLRTQRNAALAQYDQLAGRYHKSVYGEKRLELLGKIDGLLTSYFTAQLVAVKQQALSKFKEQLAASGTAGKLEFKDRIAIATNAAMADFVAQANEAVIDSSFYSFRVQQDELESELAKAAEAARATELRRILTKLSKRIGKRLETIDLHFSQEPLPENPWDAVRESLNAAIADALASQPPDFGLGGSDDEVENARLAVNVAAWKILAAKLREMTRVESVLQRLRDVFEEKFKYTDEGLPVVWNRTDDIEAAAVAARQNALRLLPLYSAARLSDGAVLAPSAAVKEAAIPADADDDEAESELDFSELLSPRQAEDIERRFKRLADTAFVEAKRSVMQMTTHIPMYIYVVLVVLGWNEFMMVLRNPLLVLLLLILGGGLYTVYSLGLTDPVLNVLEASASRAIAEGKDLLRKHLLEEDASSKQGEKRPVQADSAATATTSVAATGGQGTPPSKVGASAADSVADSDTD